MTSGAGSPGSGSGGGGGGGGGGGVVILASPASILHDGSILATGGPGGDSGQEGGRGGGGGGGIIHLLAPVIDGDGALNVAAGAPGGQGPNAVLAVTARFECLLRDDPHAEEDWVGDISSSRTSCSRQPALSAAGPQGSHGWEVSCALGE